MKLKDFKIFKEAEKAKFTYPFIVMGIIAYAFTMIGGILGSFMGMPFYGTLPDYLVMSLFSLIIGFGIIIVLCILHVKFIEKRSVVGMGFYKKSAFKNYFVGVAVGLLFMGSVVLVGSMVGAFEVKLQPFTMGALIPIGVMLIGFVIQGAAEEVLVRGWMIPLLGRRYNPIVAIILSAVYFAVYHALNPGMTIMPIINLTLCGGFLALYYVYEGSLWGVFGFHTAWNWSQGNLFGIKVSGTSMPGGAVFSTESMNGYDFISGGKFGAEGGLLCSVVLLLGIVYFYYKIKKKCAETTL